MAKWIKNDSGSSKTWVGQVVADQLYYEIQASESFSWANNSLLLTDIASGDAVVAKDDSGDTDIVDVAAAINYLKDIDSMPRDSDGSPLQRIKVTTTGWHYQLHGVEFTTSKLNSIVSKKHDATNWGFTVMKFYKLVNDVETEITGDDLNQTFLDANCIKTIIDWEPTFDIDIVGGMLRQISAPSESVDLWIIAAPDIPAQYGGSKLFVSNLDLRFMGEGLNVDGKAPKFVAYDATYHSGKFRIILRHPAGFQHPLHMVFEIFKA